MRLAKELLANKVARTTNKTNIPKCIAWLIPFSITYHGGAHSAVPYSCCLSPLHPLHSPLSSVLNIVNGAKYKH